VSWRLATVMCVIFVADQATKWLASSYLIYAQSIELAPFFSLTLLHNTGAAFSFLADAGGWQRWLFLALAVVVTGYCLRALWVEELSLWVTVGYALLVPGALGNAIDRVLFGYVVDFLHFHWQGWSFPAFNIADASITLAAVFLLIGWYVDARHRPEL